MQPYLLIDGHNLLYRSFYGVPDLMRSDGMSTNALHGFLRTLWALEDQYRPEAIAVFFDKGLSGREAVLASYKANRAAMPNSLQSQMPYIEKLCQAAGCQVFGKAGFEADDLMASAAIRLNESGKKVLLVSSDKDLAQIIGGNIMQLLPPPTANLRLGWRLLDTAGVIEKFEVRPDQIVDYLSLIGDSSDNIPGIPGVGPKTAAKWISTFGHIEGILENIQKVTPKRFQTALWENKATFTRNRELIRLKTDIALDFSLGQKSHPEPEMLYALLKELEMESNLVMARKRLQGTVITERLI